MRSFFCKETQTGDRQASEFGRKRPLDWRKKPRTAGGADHRAFVELIASRQGSVDLCLVQQDSTTRAGEHAARESPLLKGYTISCD